MSSYFVYQNPLTNNMEALIPCVNDEEEILKDLPCVDGVRVPYKVVYQLPQKYFESYDLHCTEASGRPSRTGETTLEIEQNRSKLYNLKKQEWRRLRTPLLEKYDIAFMRALELNDNNEMNRIKNIKQQLRDVTAYNVDNLTNIQLEELTPMVLTIT